MTETTRGARYFARATLRTVTTVTRCWDCGRQPNTAHGTVGIRKSADGVVGFSGLTTCGRVWLCPVCNAKVMAKRAIEIGAMLTWAAVEGYHVIWGSLTVRHQAGESLADLIAMQQSAWRHVMQSRTWSKNSSSRRVDHVHGPRCAERREIDGTLVDACERKYEYDLVIGMDGDVIDGRIGYVRAAEITDGMNGWHPHFHPIILWKGTIEAGNKFADDVVTEWLTGVTNAGGEALREGGQKLEVITGLDIFDHLNGYVTKAVFSDPSKLALETVWSQGKMNTRRVNKTDSHWSLLAGIEHGSKQDRARWVELEEATHGHRMIAWSRGLRSFAGLVEEEKTDESVAAEEVGSREDTVAVITPRGWESVQDNPAALAAILDAIAAGTLVELAAVLDEWAVEWMPFDDLADFEWDLSETGDETAAGAARAHDQDPRQSGEVLISAGVQAEGDQPISGTGTAASSPCESGTLGWSNGREQVFGPPEAGYPLSWIPLVLSTKVDA